MSAPDPGGRSGVYQWLFAWLMARLGPEHDELLSQRKRELLGDLAGTVVEIGAGTGVNLAYLGESVRYLAVEPNTHMHPHLRREAERRGRHVEVLTGSAESLPLDDGVADAVLSTLVLCSVDEVARALAEVQRVLRPGGKFVFIEHVAAEDGSRLLSWQRRVRPLWRCLGDGCEPDRDLGRAIRSAGFADVRMETFSLAVSLPLVRPHIAGVATKALPA